MSAIFRPDNKLVSWGRVVRAEHRVVRPRFPDELGFAVQQLASEGVALAVGLRRSYGDSCLNPGGAIVAMSTLERIHFLDCDNAVVRADAGLSLGNLIEVVLPLGLFPAVVPGTRFVTLGGAVANDVHGKNHHSAGTFGCHVRALSLRRSNGTCVELRAGTADPLFAATIGGLGMTGIIEWVELSLMRVEGAGIHLKSEAFYSLPEFAELSDRSGPDRPYTVAWIDCTRIGRDLGRGIFSCGAHCAEPGGKPGSARRKLKVPFDLPRRTLNAVTLKTFNMLYFAVKRARTGTTTVPYDGFFFPLDAIADWNRLYGSAGMYQYQCVVPRATAQSSVAELLTQIAKSGEGSFLAVLKTFGSVRSPGMLSFPMEGTTLALDFRNRGAATLALFAKLDDVVREAGGRLYAAKDGRIPAAMFAAGYPNLGSFAAHVDPGLSSAFWQRVRP